jgi:hypothetical protein
LAQVDPCLATQPAPAPKEGILSEAGRPVDAYWAAWRTWCAAPSGTLSLAPLLGQALDLERTLDEHLQRLRKTGRSVGPGGDSYAVAFPPGIALLFGDRFALDENVFLIAVRARGTKADRAFWELYDSFTWRHDDPLSQSNAIEHGIIEPGDPGCLLFASTDLVRSVSTLFRLEAAATAPPYRLLAAQRRLEVLGPLQRAAKQGGCLCSDGPKLATSLQALAQARKNGAGWHPFSGAAAQVLSTLNTPDRFKVLVDYECRPRPPK